MTNNNTKMAPPPVTPSPHRFIIKRQSQAPAIRRLAPPVVHQQQSTPITQSQFNAAPIFVDSTPRSTNTRSQKPSKKERLEQHAELISDNDFGEEEHEEGGIRQSIENIGDEEDLGDVEDIYDAECREGSVKRRRLNSSPIIQDDDVIDSSDQEGSPIIEEEEEEDELLLDEDNFEAEQLSSSLTDIPSPSAPTPRNRTQSRPVPRFVIPSIPQSRFQTTMMQFPSTLLPSNTNATPSKRTRFPNTTGTHQIFAKPPRFRASSPNNGGEVRGEPLPTTFSPRKRDSKYVIGGLANEVRSWILAVGDDDKVKNNDFPTSTGASSTSRLRPKNGNDSTSTIIGQKNDNKTKWKMEVLIDEVKGGYGASEAGMMMVRGKRIPSNHDSLNPFSANAASTDIKLILVGPPTPSPVDGSSDTNTGSINNISRHREKKVAVGMKIGIGGPVWEVHVDACMDTNEGEKGTEKEGWVVACSWGFL